jgi:metal-responsive CopG/Arc/MetJ family transcriptional regulator
MTMAREKGTREREERLQIMLSDEELRALDDWRFEMRMPSRAAAIRELLRLGLADIGLKKALNGRKSKDFGVMEGSKPEGKRR